MHYVLLVAGLVFAALLILGQWVVLFHVLTQQGRLLLRLDDIERELAHGWEEPVTKPDGVVDTHTKRKRLPGERPLSESRIERNGIKPGTVAPLFRLPDIHGGAVALEDYRGRRVLLVFTDPRCSPCDHLAPHLIEFHERNRNNGLALIIVGRGEPDANRRMAHDRRFEFPVVLQEHWNLSREYGIFGTPVAFLIGADGAIERNVAKGVNEILELASTCAESDELNQVSSEPFSHKETEHEQVL